MMLTPNRGTILTGGEPWPQDLDLPPAMKASCESRMTRTPPNRISGPVRHCRLRLRRQQSVCQAGRPLLAILL